MTIQSVLGIIGALFGILGLIAGAAVYLRASYAKARIDALNGEIQEEQRRSARLREDVTDLQQKLAVKDAEVAALRELVTQRVQVDQINDNIVRLRQEILTWKGSIN